ncbi:MAG: hypothetical protein C0404_05030 [Verrucomicrobia bacterium]|nr:hypothetical protein [Verrucomicrobiota bacterium]
MEVAVVCALILAQTSSAQQAVPRIEQLEVVTTNAVVGDGGNNWGGHQTRITRTKDGVFTAYTTGQSDPPGAPWRAYDGSPRYWKLALRTETGWKVIAEDKSGREPVNLMAGPDGRLHIIAWPDGIPHLWSGMPSNGAIVIKGTPIPGPWVVNNWPYGAAGISLKGDIALVQSTTEEAPGRFIWGYLQSGTNKWQTGSVPVQHRHCYSYILPEGDGRLSFTSTRDVLSPALGYKKSSTTHSLGYVFNRLGYWTTDDVFRKPMIELQVDESVPSKEYSEVWACGTSVDTYVDTKGRTHVLYFFMGPDTRGKQFIRHAVVENGKVVKMVQLPEELSQYFVGAGEKDKPKFCRMLQDSTGRFYLLGTTAIIPSDSEDGTKPGKPVPLELNDHMVEYSGIAVSSPRGGTPPSDIIDCVFPTAGGKQVVYFRLRLR